MVSGCSSVSFETVDRITVAGLTNAFSKKVENHAHAVALHFMCYNYVRIHQTLKVTPAMAAGLTDHLWDINDLVALLDANEPALKKRSRRTELTQDMVINEMRKIGFSNMQDYMKPDDNGDPILDFSDLTRDQAAALSEVTTDRASDRTKVKFRLHDKQSALVNLGKHVGCFPTRLEHGGIGGGAIEIKAVEMTDREWARRALFLLAEAQEQAKQEKK